MRPQNTAAQIYSTVTDFCQVPRLVNIVALGLGDRAGENLQRYRRQQRGFHSIRGRRLRMRMMWLGVILTSIAFFGDPRWLPHHEHDFL